MKRYYETNCGKLIIDKRKYAYQKNTLDKNKIVNLSDYQLIELNVSQFNYKLNQYFKDLTVEWIYKGQLYRNTKCIESEKEIFDLCKQENINIYEKSITVFHQGRVYLLKHGYYKWELADVYNNKTKYLSNIKTISFIYNVKKNKIIV